MLIKAIPDGKKPLFLQYPGQVFPQPAYVELDCEEETLRAGVSGDDLTPSNVYHDLALRWTVDPEITRKQAKELLARIAPLAEKILAGYDKEWNGNNLIGVFDDDADEAIEAVRALCGEALEIVVPQRAGRPRNAVRRRKMSISLPEPLAVLLTAYAEKEGMMISSVIEQAIITKIVSQD